MTEKQDKGDPLGPDGEKGWEETADRLHGDVPSSPEMAKLVAIDAQRVVSGEISEEEFYEKYHEAYLRMFGIDNRRVKRRESVEAAAREGAGDSPANGEGSAPGEQPPAPVANKPISRRAFLMLAAGGATAMAITSALGRVAPNVAYGASQGGGGSEKTPPVGEGSGNGRPVQMGMVIDLENCTGCLACVDACHRENMLETGVHWMYVMAYQDEGQESLNYLVRPCQHCTNPPCVKVCPTMARHKREKDGLVLTDYEICIGTRYCEAACPYGVNFFQWGEPQPQPEPTEAHVRDYRGRWVCHNPPRGVMGKCTFCPERQDSEARQGSTACHQVCPHDAIFFGDINDPNSPPRQHLQKKRQEKGGQLSTFRLLEEMGTGPNIIYIGHQPSRESKQVKGPVAYEDYGWVDQRRTLLEGPRPWFLEVFGG